MSDAQQRAVVKRIEETRDELVGLVESLVEQPTHEGNEAAAQEVVIDELEGIGLEPDVWEPDVSELEDHPGYFDTKTYEEYGYDGRPNVAATIDGAGDGRSLGFSGHIDVVPVDEERWSYEPWAATVENGRIYGRGTCDMKGGLAAGIHAAKVLDELGVELAGDLILESTIDEEAGGTGGALSALERGYQPDAAIITEPYGVPNIGVASAGVLYFRVTVPGRAAHAAHAFNGVNAAWKATRIFEALRELESERKQRISFQPAVNERPAAEGSVTNLNVGIFDSGDWPSTVPSEATMECRLGWPPGESREEVRTEIEETIQDVVDQDEWLSENPPELEWFGWRAEAHEVDRDAEITQLVSDNAESVIGEDGTWVGGLAGLDERFYVNYYDIPCPSVGPRGENIHGADEYVEIDSLVETAQTLALTAIDWCGTERT
ncbi:peptidase M20 family protein [Natrialba magadii ATCC 43099]|uniref:Probable succinyl-diaminopimelate desuccinylase n=1 Tax=Natrialba magadii (strain ATCC 43099 / DSM 3394 / CCM 3739 / CIP 104546 / IAM 13178 / JCM 8861 / NBRC 102185 / NCIMB 2190 / MS3) TaxID=547559 RepID=D3SVX4_NATMM|nr:ArgE/DapE family deacylase [Natrialba magadii]ADD03693.1 peptidase M20 family protein [Natrialba magadii ATCC 43099]ELY34457.1 acetylornithine deacetylase/succinyl-diaminopimelate desuccinylase [Natrialba magadii ATCC 43099]